MVFDGRGRWQECECDAIELLIDEKFASSQVLQLAIAAEVVELRKFVEPLTTSLPEELAALRDRVDAQVRQLNEARGAQAAVRAELEEDIDETKETMRLIERDLNKEVEELREDKGSKLKNLEDELKKFRRLASSIEQDCVKLRSDFSDTRKKLEVHQESVATNFEVVAKLMHEGEDEIKKNIEEHHHAWSLEKADLVDLQQKLEVRVVSLQAQLEKQNKSLEARVYTLEEKKRTFVQSNRIQPPNQPEIDIQSTLGRK